MLLTQEVEIKVRPYTLEHYKSLGYEIPMKKSSKSYFNKTGKEYVYDLSKPILVKVKDLSSGSHAKVEALCDYCQKEVVSLSYFDYVDNLKIIDKTACKKCKSEKEADVLLKKYGVNNVFQLNSVKERIEKRNIERYGVPSYLQTEEFKKKRKSTMITKYGYEHFLQDEDCRQRYMEVCQNKYGENYLELFCKKAQETFQRNTGYSHPAQSPEVKEKIRLTNLQKYGVPYAMQSPEVREKTNETLCKNGSQKTSKQQLYLHCLYGGELNYPIKYYAADICFPEEKLVIEYDGGGHDLRVTLGRLTQEEFNRREIMRSNILKREGYKRINIISKLDKLPSDDTLLQMLSDARSYFSLYPSHSWTEFNIDTSTVCNAENPEGSPYDFGVLRTIKDSDLNTIKTI